MEQAGFGFYSLVFYLVDVHTSNPKHICMSVITCSLDYVANVTIVFHTSKTFFKKFAKKSSGLMIITTKHHSTTLHNLQICHYETLVKKLGASSRTSLFHAKSVFSLLFFVAGIRIGLIPLGYEPNVQTTTPTHDFVQYATKVVQLFQRANFKYTFCIHISINRFNSYLNLTRLIFPRLFLTIFFRQFENFYILGEIRHPKQANFISIWVFRPYLQFSPF